MATQQYIESLKIEENIFELNEDIIVSFLVHFSAPFTGGSKILTPKGTVFSPHGPMRDDAMYMHPVKYEKDLLTRMDEQEKNHYEKLADRMDGYSFFITEEEVQSWNINFISGSKERLLEIFRLIRESNQNIINNFLNSH